jgi:HEAT repeat protein
MSMVGIYVTFTKLLSGTTVASDKLISGIEHGPSVARWQRAKELADRLLNKGYSDLRRDRNRATQLAQILDRELQRPTDGDDEPENATLRFYLAKALGEFDVEEGTDVLLKAATTKRTSSDEPVRQTAIEAIAIRAYNLSRLEPPQGLTDPDLEPTLLRLVEDENADIRERTVYALGQLGTPPAIDKLRVLVDDPNAESRYNAALALAHRGDAKGADTLAEMLDVAELAKRPEKPNDDPSARFKNLYIIASAIDAVHALARQNTEADLSALMKALDDLANVDQKVLDDAGVPRKISSDAKHALGMLKAKQ